MVIMKAARRRKAIASVLDNKPAVVKSPSIKMPLFYCLHMNKRMVIMEAARRKKVIAIVLDNVPCYINKKISDALVLFLSCLYDLIILPYASFIFVLLCVHKFI